MHAPLAPEGSMLAQVMSSARCFTAVAARHNFGSGGEGAHGPGGVPSRFLIPSMDPFERSERLVQGNATVPLPPVWVSASVLVLVLVMVLVLLVVLVALAL